VQENRVTIWTLRYLSALGHSTGVCELLDTHRTCRSTFLISSERLSTRFVALPTWRNRYRPLKNTCQAG
jgi:hypothetical protein